MKLNRYHFDLGNSNEGPIGFSAAVHASSEDIALGLLRNLLPTEYEIKPEELGQEGEEDQFVEYIAVYFNRNNVTLDDIDEVEDSEYNEDALIDEVAELVRNLDVVSNTTLAALIISTVREHDRREN